MNTETNQFEQIPGGHDPGPGYIPFNIGEVVEIKGYQFKIIRVSPNRLHLEPVGLVNALEAQNSKTELKEQLKELMQEIKK